MIEENKELLKMLISSIKTTKKNYKLFTIHYKLFIKKSFLMVQILMVI